MPMLHCVMLQERVPFQYLISTAHWSKYILSVGPGVLIPRPETEIFEEFAEKAIAQQPNLAQLPWCDLGTGSGAIAIAAASVLCKHNKVSCCLLMHVPSCVGACAVMQS
jgi:methylase of polypeptide subunit release factors